MSDDLINPVQKLIDLGKGDIQRLQYILETLKQGKSLFSSDQKYIEDLISKYTTLERPVELNTESIKKREEEEKSKKPYEGRIEYKSETITLIFSIIISLVGFMGVGHLYLGKIKKGIIILVLGFVKSVAGVILLIGGLSLLSSNVGSSRVMDPYRSFHMDPSIAIVLLAIGAGLLIGVVVLFFWQIFDARKLCRKYNDYVAEHGKRPW